MISLAIIIIIAYVALIAVFIIGFDRIKEFKHDDSNPTTQFTIIIPFRNEAKNLSNLLQSIENLDYPKELFEVILVNDASEDDSVTIIQRFLTTRESQHVTLSAVEGSSLESSVVNEEEIFQAAQHNIQILDSIRKSASPKKDAITTAVEQAQYDWIITTDADCILPKKWLVVFDTYIRENNTYFIAAPVTYPLEKGFLKKFQLLDLLSLQGATIGGFGIKKPFLCNGANLCYCKAIFEEVKGFEGNTEIASGDDIFLMEKILNKYPDKVQYVKSEDALIKTQAQSSWAALLDQRKRWAAKATQYKNNFGKVVALLVFAVNMLIILLILLSIFGYFKWFYLLIFFLAKSIADQLLLYKTAYHFKQQQVLTAAFKSSFFYPFFSMFVAIAAMRTRFHWKGRTFRK